MTTASKKRGGLSKLKEKEHRDRVLMVAVILASFRFSFTVMLPDFQQKLPLELTAWAGVILLAGTRYKYKFGEVLMALAAGVMLSIVIILFQAIVLKTI